MIFTPIDSNRMDTENIYPTTYPFHCTNNTNTLKVLTNIKPYKVQGLDNINPQILTELAHIIDNLRAISTYPEVT